MHKSIWALRIQEIARAIDALQTLLVINNEDPALHNLFQHWQHVLRLLHKQQTGEDYEDPFETATH